MEDDEKIAFRVVPRKRPNAFLSFRVTKEEDARVRAFAKASGATISDVVISALERCGVL